MEGLLLRTAALARGLVLFGLATAGAANASLIAGASHSCALTPAGGAMCWGGNFSGQLGDGSTTARAAPADVTGLPGGVARLAAGSDHTCALTSAGGVKCWGRSAAIGNGESSSTPQPIPSDVTGLPNGVVSLAAGESHTCAVMAGGGVKCWGYNVDGQLGDGTTFFRAAPVDVPGLPGPVVAIAAGGAHSCALTATGGVACWGANGSGQLGDNSTTGRLAPVAVDGLPSGVVAIAAGRNHTCALMAGGGAKCWGDNSAGQLGDGTTTGRLAPVDVSGLAGGVAALATGGAHTCALMSGGGMKCWGRNANGQVGDGTTTDRLAPADVTGIAGGLAAIAVGDSHSCALATSGTARCWGANALGQLGDGTTVDRAAPVAVTGFPPADIVPDAFAFTPALGVAPGSQVTSNAVSVFGITGPAPISVANGSYSIACTSDFVTTPGTINNLELVCVRHTAAASANTIVTTTLTIGGVTGSFSSTTGAAPQSITMAPLLDRGVGSPPFRVTGFATSGLPVAFASLTPGVCGVSGATVTVQSAGTCTIAADQAGDANWLPAPRVTGGFAVAAGVDPDDVVAIAAGGAHSCALSTGGGASCWGDNQWGQLGDGTTTNRWSPVGVSGLSAGVAMVSGGQEYSCALTAAGGVRCWGSNSRGQLGDGTLVDRQAPTDVSGLSFGVSAIATGKYQACALMSGGGLKCWGNNDYGQLGDGTSATRPAPADVSGLAGGVIAVAAGGLHTCALLSGGSVKCWGFDGYGELGDGTPGAPSLVPVDVAGLDARIVAISAGDFHTCALTSAGTVKCWGNNTSGQLGDGGTADRATPADVTGLPGPVAAIAAGAFHTCALMATGAVRCWGTSRYGQVGDNSIAEVRSTPVEVVLLGTGARAIAAGGGHSCALTTVGGVACWGGNFAGQLGNNGATGPIPIPVTVVGLDGLDTTPDAFSFTPALAVVPGSLVTSNAVTVTGLTDPAPISVANGSYSIACTSDFVTTPGTIANLESVCVRHTASATANTTVTTTLTIGGVAGDFASTTTTPDTYLLGLVVDQSQARATGTFSTNGPVPGTTFECSFDGGPFFACTSPTTQVVTVEGLHEFRVRARDAAGNVDPTPDAQEWLYDVTPPDTVITAEGLVAGGTTSATQARFSFTSPSVELFSIGFECSLDGAPFLFCGTGFEATGLASGAHELRARARDAVGNVDPTPATFSWTVVATQSITFAPMADRGVGSLPFEPVAFASSGLPVSFTSLTPAVCAVGFSPAVSPSLGVSAVTLTTTGTCTIAADQPGNGSFLPAPRVTRSFDVKALADPGDVVAVASGESHACALGPTGSVKCWGSNDVGQLGNGTTNPSSIPVAVVGLGGSALAITAGGLHTCALLADGAVKCWGYNAAGQLGDGTSINRLLPVAAAIPPGSVAAISAGGLHTCAVTSVGEALCWGDNTNGRLGNGTSTSSPLPVSVVTLEGPPLGTFGAVVRLSAGSGHTCALSERGGVRCWGDNSFGQLGDDSTVARNVAVPVGAFGGPGTGTGAVSISAGRNHTCAVSVAGGVKCWGNNSAGTLGTGDQVGSLVPQSVVGLAGGAFAVTAGRDHTCALAGNGQGQCWGANGALGNGTFAFSLTPVDVVGLAGPAVSISAGRDFTCASTQSGEARCWGDHARKQLGIGDIAPDNCGTRNPTPCALAATPVVGLDGMDTSPDPFSFPTRTGVPVSSTQVSAALVPAGFYDPAPVSVTGGQYSVGCTGSFVSTPGAINPGESVCVRHVASANDEGIVTTTLTVGGVSGTFTSITAPRGALTLSPTRLDFTPRQVGTTSASQVVTVTNTSLAPINGLGWGVNSDFVVSATTCGTSLAVGASCTISITFTPIALGERADELLVFATNPVVMGRVLLSGYGLASDTTPGAFTFTDQFLVAPSTVITSAPVQVTGLTGAAPVSVANGSYCVSPTSSCSSCAFRQDPSTITDGQYLCARHTSSPIPGGQVDTLVFVGGLGDAFTSITIDTVPAPFGFAAVSGVQPATVQASGAAAIVGINAPSPISVTGGEYSVGCTGTWTSTAGTVANGQTVCVRHVAAPQYGSRTSTTLTVGGVTGSFVTTTAPATSIPRLGNISTRMQVLTGNDVLIGGFIIGGTQPKTVVVRARGPSLVPFGITNFLANPQLQLFSGQTQIAANDDWATSTNSAALTASGFAPEIAQESAILTTLAPGAYTAIVSGVGGTTGVGIVELFEVDLPEVPLANISTRGSVLTGNDVMIGGFIIQGDRPQTVIVRARGPSLADFGITNPLANPVLQLFSGQTMIAMNDNWQEAAEAGQVLSRGFAPASPFESAILITLNPGAYTAIVTGAGGTTGVGIIEVFAQ